MTTQLTREFASRFANVALAHLTREYPNKLTHSLEGPQDVQGPRALHPIFYGSYDWHSCVHGYWLILHLLERFPDLPEAARIIAVVDEHFTAANVAGELAYLDLPHNRGFERPYGWAWLLALGAQLQSMKISEAARWAKTFAPLTQAFVERFEEFLPKATYPLRVGTHFNMTDALGAGHTIERTVRAHRVVARKRRVAFHQIRDARQQTVAHVRDALRREHQMILERDDVIRRMPSALTLYSFGLSEPAGTSSSDAYAASGPSAHAG